MEWEVAGVGRKARLELAEPLLTDGWILAKFLFPVLLTETRPIYNHLDRTSLVNKGVII